MKEYFDHLYAVSIVSSPFFCRKHPQMAPRVGVSTNRSLSGGGQLEHLEYTQYFGNILKYTAGTRSVLGFNILDTLDVCTAGTAVLGVLY